MTVALEDRIEQKHKAYSKSQAVAEANRCLYCFDPPCVKACPTSIDIPSFIKKIATDNLLSSAKTIFKANILGHSCAKVCPVEVLCAGSCVLNERDEEPLAIGRLQDFATTFAMKNYLPEEIMGTRKALKNKRIALLGAGPASIAAAALLAFEGYQTTIFDRRKKAGGLNAHGVAPYKLKHVEALHEIAWLSSLGIEFCLGLEIGEHDIPGSELSAKSLIENYDAIFIGVGLGKDRLLPISGLDGPGVMGACELIERIKTDPSLDLSHFKKAHVIGGGNTALDIAHELKLLGLSQVTVLYRGKLHEMSAYAHEQAHARLLGVEFLGNTSVTEIVREDKKLLGFRADQSSDLIASDLIVFAIGQEGASRVLEKAFNLEVESNGRIKVDPARFRSSNSKVWSAGDCVNGGKEVVDAVFEAKIAVADMIKALESE